MRGRTGALLLLTSLCVAPAALADEAQAPMLALELNAADEIDGACRLTFLVNNGLGADLATFVAETVIFTPEQRVERLTLFDFQAIPAGRPRVRQFDLQGVPCAQVGSVLINGLERCDGEALSAEICQAALDLTSRTEIGLDG